MLSFGPPRSPLTQPQHSGRIDDPKGPLASVLTLAFALTAVLLGFTPYPAGAQVRVVLDVFQNIEVQGTPTGDRILVAPFRQQIVVLGIDGNGNATLTLAPNPARKFIRVLGQGGDDIIISTAPFCLSGHGHAGRDVIIGGPKDDDINGGPDPNILFGLAGMDRLKGGGATDLLSGGDGDDIVFGDPWGQPGANDLILAGSEDDWVNGRGGNDSILLQPGADSGWGGDGHDFIDGGRGKDNLDGQADNDLLCGSMENDTLQGGFGDDRLYGEDHTDHMDGGLGDDHLYGDPLLEGDTFANGNEHHGRFPCPIATDSSGIEGVDEGPWYHLPDLALILQGTDGNDVLHLVAGEDGLKLSTLSPGEKRREYKLSASLAKLTIVAELLDGHDVLVVEGSVHEIIAIGGSGHDTLDVSKATYSFGALLAGPGYDSLVAGSGETLLVGQRGLDELTGGSSRDIFLYDGFSIPARPEDPQDLVIDRMEGFNVVEGSRENPADPSEPGSQPQKSDR